MTSDLVSIPTADLESLIAKSQQRFLSISSAAAYSDLSECSIRRLLAAGKLGSHRPVKGKILIDRVELDGLILNSTAVPRKGRGRK